MDGIYTELRYLFENEYPGVNMFSAKLGAPEFAPVEAAGGTVVEDDVVIVSQQRMSDAE